MLRSDLLNQLVRAVVLMLLLAYFVVSLVRGLVEEERLRSPLRGDHSGADPGVRVLLENRTAPEPTAGWDRLDITIRQNVEVFVPTFADDPANHLQLHSGSVLHIQPDTNVGLLLSSREWGKDYTWPVSTVRICPTASDPQAPVLGNGQRQYVGYREPRVFEAADHDAVFSLAGASYRGSLEVLWHSAKDVEAINKLPIEAYVEGVIAVEMSPAFPLQALKAQAVASRSYAYAQQLQLGNAREYDVVDTGDDQEYRGTGKGNDTVRTATWETRGSILVVGHDLPFVPRFCASSGGYTESIDHVFPGQTDARLHSEPLGTVMMAQPDRFCQPGCENLGLMASHWQTTTSIVPDELMHKLAKLLAPVNKTVGFIQRLRAGVRDPHSGRVLSVLILHTGSLDPIEMTANSFRQLVGAGNLRSTLWTAESPRRIDPADARRTPVYEITATGYGHGVGMSQVSAWEMANENYSYLDILSFFYLRSSVHTEW